MPMKLHETHPSLVHYPLSFFPLSLAADALGEALDRDDLREMGRITMPLAAGSAAMAAMSGLVAQQEVEGSDHAFDMLITHRNLNLLAGALTAGLALWRWGRERSTPGYLAAGLAGLGGMIYSAYLGGHMVYTHGMGVREAGGVREDVPELSVDEAGRAAMRTGEDVVEAAKLTAEETAEGELAPSLRHDGDGGEGEGEE